MKGKIIIKSEEPKTSIFIPILEFILGIILITNSNKIVVIGFQIVGAIVLIFGIYNLIRFYQIKKQWKVENQPLLVTGAISCTIGLLVILLATVLEVGLRYIIGFFLLCNGINKAIIALSDKNLRTSPIMVEGLVLCFVGLYTILFQNAALVFIGIILIIASITEIINIIKK